MMPHIPASAGAPVSSPRTAPIASFAPLRVVQRADGHQDKIGGLGGMLSKPLLPLGNGRYDLREVLGARGMATVYRAYDQRLQCERAIKVLAPALSERASVRNRFIAEARMMARLQHPNIVHVDEVVF